NGERMADSRQTRPPKTPAASQAPAGPGPPLPPPATASPAQPHAVAEPHPVSSHRTPREIAKEEAGPGGPLTEPQPNGPFSHAAKAPRKEEEHIRAAVQRSAHPSTTRAPRRAADDPSHRTGKR